MEDLHAVLDAATEKTVILASHERCGMAGVRRDLPRRARSPFWV